MILGLALVAYNGIAAGAEATAAGSAQSIIYRSDFGSDVSGFRQIYRYYGNAALSLDNDRNSRPGKPSLRVDFQEKTKTMIGIVVNTKPSQRFRLSLAGCADLEQCGQISVCAKCVEVGGTRDTWIGLGMFPQGLEFENFTSQPFEVAPFASQIQVFLFATDVVGKLWIADVVLEPFEMPPETEAKLRASGPTRWGVCDALATGYHQPHDATISDTCAKLMSVAGATSDRIACWWGSRDQMENDINQGRGWLVVDRRGDQYDFSELDERIELLAHYGLQPGPVTIHGTPVWASGKTSKDLPGEANLNWRARRRPFFPPGDWSDYEDFVFALVTRFKDRVRIWEVMNEPNIPDSGLQGGYRTYMKYLRHFYRAAKRADDQCTVLCARVGPDWLESMFEDDRTIADCFDGLVSHPYTDSGTRSFAKVRDLQLRMASAGYIKPIHVTEVGFFGGKWQDSRPGDAIQAEMAAKLHSGLPWMARVSDNVTWWTAAFPSYAHGLLRDEGLAVRPLEQYWAFGEVTGRLSKRGGPVKASVQLPLEEINVGRSVKIRLTAMNASDRPQRVRFWPVGFVSALGVTLKDIRAAEWQGTLAPGAEHSTTLTLRPGTNAADVRFPIGLAVLNSAANALALEDIRVETPDRDGEPHEEKGR